MKTRSVVFPWRAVSLALIVLTALTIIILFSVATVTGEEQAGVSDQGMVAKIQSSGDFTPLPAGQSFGLSSGEQALMEATNGAAEVNINSATGYASFVRIPAGSLELPVDGDASASDKARAFMVEYGGIFGVKDVDSELLFSGVTSDMGGGAHVSYQQVYQGVPAFAGVLRVHFDAAGRLSGANGAFLPDLNLRAAPNLALDEANAIAVREVSSQSGLRGMSSDLAAVNTQLVIYRTGLAQGITGQNHLAYQVEVANTSISVREFVYVDAHEGQVLEQITGTFDAKDRTTWDAQNDAAGANSVICRQEGDPDSGIQACDEAHNYAGDTYDYYFNAFGRDSLDDAGMSLISYYNVCPGGPASCPWYNASWNGEFMSYGTTPNGRSWTADDTVGHELSHGVTDFTSNLIYLWQPGAINEAMSDIFGELVDYYNGAGIDTPDLDRVDYPTNSTATFPDPPCIAPYGSDDQYSYTNVRWLQGEEDYLIRDMWAPSCYGDPDHVSHVSYHCSGSDGGGVHTNSGVPNHHYALLVEGGVFNGQTISPTGHIKAGAIYYTAQANYLTPSSDFADLANALSAACSDLIGVNLPNPVDGTPSGEIISAADCTEVDEASLAVEYDLDPAAQCNFEPMLDPNAPALCEGLGTVNSISLTDWEAGLGSWTVGTRDVANPATFDTPDWAVVTPLPDGRSGSAAFVEDNPAYGNCADDTEAGVLYLESPVISMPTDAFVPRIAVDHWNATELGWDGGNFKISVNGGPWTLIPAVNFDFNPYNSILNPPPGNDNPMAGEAAFTGTDEGAVTGSWGQSQISLIGLAGPGDDIQIRVEMGLDGCNGVLGWFVDDFEVYSCSDELPGLACGDGVIDPGETCDDGNTADGDGCSSVCQVEDGYFCGLPVESSTGSNAVEDESFEAGSPNPYWTEYSLNFGTPLCTAGICGTGSGTGPNTGQWWAWFGGIGTYEEGSVTQDVTIPTTATDMTFYLEQIVCDSPADYLEVLVDGTQVFLSDGSSPLCGNLGYTMQTVDVSAYADGATHTIEFHSEIFAQNQDVSNFFVDDVVISDNQGGPGNASICVLKGLCSDQPFDIPDGDANGITDTMSIDMPGSVGDLNIYLDASHTWVGDLIFSLTHEETGTAVTFIDRPGVPASTWGCSGNDIDAVIDDEGTYGSVETTCDDAPALGNILTPDPDALSAFDGELRSGTWTLWVSDNASPDPGTVNEWCIAATSQQPTDVSLSGLEGDAPPLSPLIAVWLGLGAIVVIVTGRIVARRRNIP